MSKILLLALFKISGFGVNSETAKDSRCEGSFGTFKVGLFISFVEKLKAISLPDVNLDGLDSELLLLESSLLFF